jgi:hypothetical protein
MPRTIDSLAQRPVFTIRDSPAIFFNRFVKKEANVVLTRCRRQNQHADNPCNAGFSHDTFPFCVFYVLIIPQEYCHVQHRAATIFNA